MYFRSAVKIIIIKTEPVHYVNIRIKLIYLKKAA